MISRKGNVKETFIDQSAFAKGEDSESHGQSQSQPLWKIKRSISILKRASMSRAQSSSLPTIENPSGSSGSIRRRGLTPGGSDHFNRYKVLKRRQKRLANNSRGDGAVRRISSSEEDDPHSSNSDRSLDTDPDEEIQKVVTLVRSLANELYLPLKERHSTNLVYSPLGFCISTVMLKLSCCGVANKEIARALLPDGDTNSTIPNGAGDGDRAEESCSELVTGLQAILDELVENPSQTFTFKHASKIYLQAQQNGVKQSFKTRVKAICPRVELEEVDFSNEKWEHVSSAINKWVHSAGGKMLGDVLTKRTVNNSMIYVNPVVFEGNWMYPFNPEMTQDMRFFENEKEFVDVPMMRSGLLKNLLYLPMNKLACRALVLPFKGNRLCFVIFLPNEKCALSTIETGLENISPAEYFKNMNEFRKKLSSRAGFQVLLPKFHIDCTIDCEGPMKEMGIETVFQPGKADFSSMINTAGASPSKEHHVTQILQKVLMVVSEVGAGQPPTSYAEAPDKTRRSIESDSTNKDEPPTETEIIEFCVNHPFYFQVVDMKSDLIVLAGSCKNPLQGKDMGFTQFLEKYDIKISPKQDPTSGCIKSHGKR